ncbi:ribonuclease P 40kDa subunit [Biscogniauxia mediterranea]|nr:ribonuclease P 40kDa subunit [Biscogniauxia mediterranea]
MFSFSTPSVYQSSKCFVTYGTLAHTDAKQLPSKVKPWSTFLAQDFVHKVDLILPEESLHFVRDKIMGGGPVQAPSYHRVIMTLGQVLEGDFFTQYIKIGNIMMLSEGRIDSDNVFSLKEGRDAATLSLYSRPLSWAYLIAIVVQFDLRSPSMLHGKKGFDRLAYACKTVLNKPTTWLFCDLSKESDPDPLRPYHPVRYTSSPALIDGLVVNVPSLTPPQAVLESGHRSDLGEYATDIYEWLSLVRLESPRLSTSDTIDPYLSTYAVPGNPEDIRSGQLCKVSWQGFISPDWVRRTFADVIQGVPSKSWFSLSATSFARGMTNDSTDCTVLKLPDTPGEYFLWEIK